MSGWLDWLETIGDDYNGTFSVLFGLATVVGAIVGALALRKSAGLTRLDHLRDHHTWPDLLASLPPSAATAYFTGIARVSGFASRVYGERLFSWRAFDRALLIAFLYPIAALLLGWVLFDAGQLGGTKFLPEGLAWGRRIAVAITIALATSIMLWVAMTENMIASQKKEPTKPDNAARDYIPIFSNRIEKIVFWFGSLSAITFIVAVVFLNIKVVTFNPAYTIFFFPISFTFSIAVARRVALAFGLTFSACTTVFIISATPDSVGALASFGLFLALLPLLNACADFLSVAATRWFLRHIAPGPGKPQGAGTGAVVLGVLADLALAVACLAGLLWSITATLDLWARLHPATLPLDWRAYRTSLCAGDLGRGTMLWLMLVTTLLPTAVHLAAGFAALLTRNARIDGAIHAILAPAAQRLEARHGQTVWQIDPSRRWDEVLSTADLGRLDTLCGQRGSLRTWVFLGLLVLAMAALIGVVAGLGALISPWVAPLCPSAA